MGFRFRRSVRLFPGVRLNLSSKGISTSIGVRGASVTVGPRGGHLNVGIPGTGLSYRQPLGRPSGRSGPQLNPQPLPLEFAPQPLMPIAPSAEATLSGEIKSAANEQLTSVSLRELRDLLAEAYHESQRLRNEIPTADQELLATRTRAYSWGKGHVLRRLFKARYQAILTDFAEAEAERKSLDDEIEKCRVALEIEMEGGIDTTYGSMVETFRALAGSERCWDNVAAVGVDQQRERSVADRSISRRSVELDLRSADVIAPSRPALHLPNANGGDLYILPGLLLVLGNTIDFALVRLTEVKLTHEPVRFFEEEEVPADTEVVGDTWKRVNKDGRPDRRFADNYRIPIVRYGLLKFTSASGLNEEFMFSSDAKATAFAAAYAKHRAALPIG